MLILNSYVAISPVVGEVGSEWLSDSSTYRARGAARPEAGAVASNLSRNLAVVDDQFDSMRRYHFHVFDGRNYAFDGEGMMLPDLTAVVSEAEKRAGLEMSARGPIQDWTHWKIDVRGEDDITIFFYPFEELRRKKTGPA